jgi:hypothetical protein
MKKNLIISMFLLLLALRGISQPIIADHTVVDKFNTIPQTYIDQVKKMWVSFAGESHSEAYRAGCQLLQALDSKFQVSVTEDGNPEPYTTAHLRISRATWGSYGASDMWVYNYGEEDWFTNSTAISRTKDGLLYCKNSGPALAALGFAWCWDANSENPLSGSYDAVYGTRWSGESLNGPQGSLPWGLDAADQAITGNSVCMETYITATDGYVAYCNANSIPTKIIYTTGPIDNNYNFGVGEQGYQRYLKYQYIREHVNSLASGYFFDFADILSYNNAGVKSTTTWTDHNGTLQTFPIISDENNSTSAAYHFGTNGALKIGKAVWWLLARMAGWNGVSTGIQDTKATDVPGMIIESNSSEIKVHISETYLSGQISLYDLQGSLVEKRVIDADYTTFSKSALHSGLYLVVVNKNNLIESKKVVVSN